MAPKPFDPSISVAAAEHARRVSVTRAWVHLAWSVMILALWAGLAGGTDTRSVMRAVLLGVAIVGLTLAGVEYLVRPKRLSVDGNPAIGFLGLMVLSRSSGSATPSVTRAGRLVFEPGRLTWIPSAAPGPGGAGNRVWSIDTINALRVERLRNPTPLGYVQLLERNGDQVAFRVFQPRRIRALVATVMSEGSVVPDASGVSSTPT